MDVTEGKRTLGILKFKQAWRTRSLVITMQREIIEKSAEEAREKATVNCPS